MSFPALSECGVAEKGAEPRRSVWKPARVVTQASTPRMPLRPRLTLAPPAFLESLVREHQSALFATALRLSGNPTDAQDLVQDTFERAHRKADQFVAGTQARAWLVTILHHLFIDRCRRNRREQTTELAPELELASEPAAEEPAWSTITSAQVQAALERINPDFRAVYRLHALEGRSYQEIAQALEIPKATVGTRLARARTRLKELLLPLVRHAESKPLKDAS